MLVIKSKSCCWPVHSVFSTSSDHVLTNFHSAQVVSDSILRRLQMTQLRVIFFSLGLVDILMDRCSTPFHKQVASQAFMKQLIAMLNNPKMNKEVNNLLETSNSLSPMRASRHL